MQGGGKTRGCAASMKSEKSEHLKMHLAYSTRTIVYTFVAYYHTCLSRDVDTI